MTALRELIADGRAHLLDGAMGTMLYNRGIFVNVCYDELNLSQPQLVGEVHEAYLRAGAEVVETNTFGANPIKLSAFSLADRTEEINRAAVAIACRAARGRASVVGAIGPLGIRLEPWGPTSKTEAAELFTRQITGLVDGGVDGFVLETFGDLDELYAALGAVRRRTDLPVIAQVTVGDDGNTPYGTPVETVAARLTEWGADVIGLNCSVGPAPMLDAIERMAEVTDRPLAAQPNAGLPRAVGDRRIYLASPEYMAQYARRMIEAGARFVGGCCGTTPEHIRRIGDAVRSMHPASAATGQGLPPSASGSSAAKHGRSSAEYHASAVAQSLPAMEHSLSSAAPGTSAAGYSLSLAEPAAPSVPAAEVPLAARSALGRKLAEGAPVIIAQLLPPRGWNPAEMIASCRTLAGAGVDAIGLLDTPRAQSRMGVLPAAMLIEREVGIETVFHYTCRDRNMLGMLSDLLGAAAGGLRNLLIVTGDPPSAGPYPDATAVFDIDSIGLTNVVHQLNRGLDPGGAAIGEPTRFVIGVAANPGAPDLDRELERLAWKVEAGAELAITQPVFDPDTFARFVDRLHGNGHSLPIVAGLWPLTSVRNAEFLANEVPGIGMPPAIIDRMRETEARGTGYAEAEGLRIAVETYEAIRGMVQGVQVNASHGGGAAGLAAIQAITGTRPSSTATG